MDSRRGIHIAASLCPLSVAATEGFGGGLVALSVVANVAGPASTPLAVDLVRIYILMPIICRSHVVTTTIPVRCGLVAPKTGSHYSTLFSILHIIAGG